MDVAGVRSTFNQQVNAVEWSESITSEFGIAALRFCKEEIIGRALSTTLPILKKSEFQKLEIIVPPMDLQRDFSNRAQRVARLRLRIVDGAGGIDSLFSSLQHRAFSGQL
jgi:type I restriction enzyme S subunit